MEDEALRHQFRGFEEIFRTKYYNLRFNEGGPAPDLPFDHVNAGGGACHVGSLGKVCGGGFDLLQAQLVGNAVFVEDVGDAFYFTCRRCEEGDPVAGFHQGPRLGDGHLHVAVEGHGRAGGDVQRATGCREACPTPISKFLES